MNQFFNSRSLCCVVVCLFAIAWTGVLSAAPVYTIIVDRQELGAGRFFEDLSHIWKDSHVPAPGRLAVTHAAGPQRRLRLLSRGRGEFAIIDTGIATTVLIQHKGLAAVALLWPAYLHAVTRSSLPALELPIRHPVKVAANARYAFDALKEWNRDRKQIMDDLALLTEGQDFLQDLNEKEDVLLFSAPAPLANLLKLMEEDSTLRLLPISHRLTEDLRLLYPWLQTEGLPAGVYPRMKGRQLLPARHLVIVGRRDLPEEIVSKMLISLYDNSAAVAPYNPLFGAMNPKLNQAFVKLFPFHPVTAKKLGFPKN